MKCPDCSTELITTKKFGQGVWFCTLCKFAWFILKIRRKV